MSNTNLLVKSVMQIFGMKQTGYFKRQTKIVCTIGSVTGTASVIERLIRSGITLGKRSKN